MSDIKTFLYTWCSKSKTFPQYEFRATGTKHKPRFLCECRIPGQDYVSAGNSTTKKDAQTNAAKDMVQYLIRKGIISEDQAPKLTEAVVPLFNQEAPKTSGYLMPQMAQQKLDEEALQVLKHNKKLLEEAEEADFSSDLHGGWTIENAKSKLHHFLQVNKITADYKYQSIGPDHARTFVAEMSFYVPCLRRSICGREHGSTKLIASKSCALSLVRQLFHLQAVEAFTGSIKEVKEFELPPCKVELDMEVEHKLNYVLHINKIQPNLSHFSQASVSNPISLVISNFSINSDQSEGFSRSKDSLENQSKVSVVSWAPPKPNWNPWTSCNIDEGYLSTITMDQISHDLKQNLTLKHNSYQIMRERNNLPIHQKREEILETISRNSVVLIKGDTGCGKTTQVPQYLLDDFIMNNRGAHCNIIITQPRRISAISIADRVSRERGEELGISTGYSVRFESIFPRTYGGLLFCTVGSLLRKMDVGLRGISHLIVDEIHERDLNTDFLLIILRDMVQSFPDIRIVLMSATVDTSFFQNYFPNCELVNVSGRSFPVKEYFLEDIVELLNYQPLHKEPKRKKRKMKSNEGALKVDEEDDDDDDDEDIWSDNMSDMTSISAKYSERTKQVVQQLSQEDIDYHLVEAILKYILSFNDRGSVLVFLSGWSTIFSLQRHLSLHPLFGSNQFLLLPLHSQLPKEEQQKVFRSSPPGVMKIILATNIAESSITIDDVTFVIDYCQMKMKMFTSHNNMLNYSVTWCSKSNLEQRKGRAGRVKPGYCFYLCSRLRYQRLDDHMSPEMVRSPLHQLCLSIKMLNLGPISSFLCKAIQPPPIDAVIEAEALLRELKAFDRNDQLTPLGRLLARLPIEPRIGKMLIYSAIFRCGDAACTLAASCTYNEPFIMERRRLERVHLNMAGKKFSDHFTLLNAFQLYMDAKSRGEKEEVSFCQSNLLSLPTMRMTFEAKNQLVTILTNAGFPDSCFKINRLNLYGEDPNLDLIGTLLCFGLYPNVCIHKSKRKLLTGGNKPALFHKSSVNCTNVQINFPIPYFIFSEKIRSKVVCCKQTTMISPLQILLFACRSIRFNSSILAVDSWLNLIMDPNTASKISMIRSLLENYLSRVTADPESLEKVDSADESLIDLIVRLSSMRAARFTFSETENLNLLAETHEFIQPRREFPNRTHQSSKERVYQGWGNNYKNQEEGGGFLNYREDNYGGSYENRNHSTNFNHYNQVRERIPDNGTWGSGYNRSQRLPPPNYFPPHHFRPSLPQHQAFPPRRQCGPSYHD